ncbi:MAG: hypothetical protein WBV69_18390 [Candidatus Sulfotelmatobacter sp.]
MTPALSGRIRHLVKRLAGLAILTVAVFFAIAYAVDYSVFRYRLAANRAFGQLTVNSYEAVRQKNGKTEFLFNPPQVQTCVNCLFPRAGYSPCWYLRRHTEQRTDI